MTHVATVAAAQSNVMPQKLKPVPNPATNFLQLPESMASMLNAADKALDKAQKTSKRPRTNVGSHLLRLPPAVVVAAAVAQAATATPLPTVPSPPVIPMAAVLVAV